MSKIQCPQCGAKKHQDDVQEKLFVCEHCFSLFFIENIAKIKHSLILQKDKITIRDKSYQLLDASQLQHEGGIRTEWLLQDRTNKRFILTEEDENFSLVTKVDCQLDKDINWNALQPNTQLPLLGKTWLLTEKIEFCVPDCPNLHYSYLTGENAELLILIFQYKQISCRLGFWLDAFEINEN